MPTVSGALRRLVGRLGRARRGSAPSVASTAADVDLLVSSALFDDAWYSLCLDRPLSRRAAVEHYLGRGRERGFTPHPLFAPDFCAQHLGLDPSAADAVDPLVTYLRERRFDVAVHPLFETGRYVGAMPEALDHPDGPLGHYQDLGAGQGTLVNDWYRPDLTTEPRGLIDWVWADAEQWAGRRRVRLSTWVSPKAEPVSEAMARPVTDERIGLTSVVLVVEEPGVDLAPAVRSVLGQTTQHWELIVLGVGTPVELERSGIPNDPRILLVPEPQRTVWAARNAGLSRATGIHVLWMSAGDDWAPGRLSSLHHALVETASPWAHDCAREDRPKGPRRHASRRMTRARLLAGTDTELGTVIVTRELATALGGFDESLRGGHTLDFFLRLSAHGEPGFAPGLGTTINRRRGRSREPDPNDRPWVDFEQLGSSADVVLNRHAVDWAALGARRGDAGMVSVVILTYQDWELTTLAVRRVTEACQPHVRVEVIVVDNGCGVAISAVLGSLEYRFDEVRVVRAVANHGFSLGNNLGLAHVRGDIVVFLNNDTEVQPGWLDPLLQSLRDEEVLGAQSLLLYPDGTIQSAGIVFPRGNGLPHMLLRNFPVEDAAGLEVEPLHALTAAALAVRFDDAVALRGFDPIFRNGMEDVDFCLRLGGSRPGRFVVRPDSVVIHHESRTPGRFAKAVMNRRVLLERWAGRLPEDDVEAWRRRGFEVAGHEIRSRPAADRRLCVAEPVLFRRPRSSVVEGLPSLRWAIKHAAPVGPEGEKWGDTHFARQLAAALRELGQEVVIDHRQSFERSSETLDDVVLLLRGLTPYTPILDRVNLIWLISHPEVVRRSEHVGWDRVYVASVPFARLMAEQWHAPAVPLLQATDPTVFHPDIAEPDTGHRVLFIGNSRRRVRPLVVGAAAQGLPLSVYGSGWEGLIPERFIRGVFVPNAEVGAAYRAAGVVLNDHWSDMRSNGFLSNRLFDAVAAGARVITDDVAGVGEVFGDSVKVVSSPDELSTIVNAPDLDAVFGSDEVRRARAAKVAAEHSFAVRARTLLEDAARIRAGRGLR